MAKVEIKGVEIAETVYKRWNRAAFCVFLCFFDLVKKLAFRELAIYCLFGLNHIQQNSWSLP